MTLDTRLVTVTIGRTVADVYEYVSNPVNLPRWADGLGSSIESVAGKWFAQSPMGRVEVAFAPQNSDGILDHTVTMPDGRSFDNRMRVSEQGGAAEVVFTVRRQPGQSESEFARDVGTVAADLNRLKEILESATV